MKGIYNIPTLPLPYDLETKTVLKQLNRANRKLAELKGVAKTIPNETILISTLTLQEAKDSSAVENIVTTQDDLFHADLRLHATIRNASAKEVLDYREAIQNGFAAVRASHLLTLNTIKDIQQTLECNNAGFRREPGTQLKRNDGSIVYTPPQNYDTITRCMVNLEQFINDDTLCDLDPLIKMAVIHHQFESIHPFYDGNGRTGRIINILYLVAAGLLELPVLYLSRYIIHNKGEYYRLIQAVRDKDGNNAAQWEAWVVFMLKGVEEIAADTINLVLAIGEMMNQYKQTLRPLFGKQYKHELLNNLFSHPYTKIEYVERDMQVSRITAAKYLNRIVDARLLDKQKIGNHNYYINSRLADLFLSVSDKYNKRV
ncbi:MAG: Fic family protein [Prevotella sp.]|nr:Fic family protein [Prevotella sp.]